jgi:hypothetical protein
MCARILLALAGALLMASSSMAADVPRWGRFEAELAAGADLKDPVQDATLEVQFTAPSGKEHTVLGFWDGGRTWRVRFMPDEVGRWKIGRAHV